jgi:hypothetical protein
MGAPKSVIKLDKNGIKYTSSVDTCSYYIHELTRAALRDVGKFLARAFRDSYYSTFKKHSGKAGRATKYKVFASKTTTAPRVQIGLKTGQVPGFYSYFQEVGTSKTPKLGLLKNAAESNVAEIIKIESQYLSALSDEANRLASMVEEDDYEGDADE